jgi:YHS domain-containing protein
MMRTHAFALLAASALLSTLALAEEFENICAWALADRGIERRTDCSVSWKDPATGKTYCFSNEQTRMLFLQDPEENIPKAEEAYTKLRKQQ